MVLNSMPHTVLVVAVVAELGTAVLLAITVAMVVFTAAVAVALVTLEQLMVTAETVHLVLLF